MFNTRHIAERLGIGTPRQRRLARQIASWARQWLAWLATPDILLMILVIAVTVSRWL